MSQTIQNGKKWIDKIENIDGKDVNVAIVGKYTKLEDSYISV